MSIKKFLSPLALPIYVFAAAIVLGGVLLCSPFSHAGPDVSFLDALFTATSATCVTGLAVVDTGTAYSTFGQVVILLLIQLGGLGIMTYASLFFYLWRRRVSLTDHIAVGQSLMQDPSFHLGHFLLRVVACVAVIESVGALALHLLDPQGFSPFSAVFHSVSAFCNAGFGLFSDNLMGYRGNAGVNLVIMALIVLGGLGFTVLVEMYRLGRERLRPRERLVPRRRLSWYSRTVLTTSAFLIAIGAVLLFIGEMNTGSAGTDKADAVLAALFQSVTCRTAGFNTLDIGHMGEASLIIMILLMFIGGSPGSCAGGIKTTTFRVLAAFGRAQMRGGRQAVIGRYAVDDGTLNRAMTLTIFALGIVLAALLVLCFTEGATMAHHLAPGRFMDILFEVVSAFGTVGLSTGLTPHLTPAGKIVIIVLMFVGRLGPIVFLSVLQGFQERPRYQWPEQGMLIG
ncbi:potassium transporter TrkH [Desulfovibrio sulfodismutans]|uniref:Potassium transporter TrkH n=1 Tax=Desulfolutivibrio sulfodismutans TaxID=63561 RepID=A0A7K3NMV6_9BACT|nr:TrkH family potassium uptake protein [Desulfolutivibrio sulfodismutans]NDY56539.1 potassium transporter TrkH [Desulfolutivibrio sulfodismutans]QLA13127.1 potassium transporter TrkH [Desulfolutivibrio sulfodismutans DSM 3696]